MQLFRLVLPILCLTSANALTSAMPAPDAGAPGFALAALPYPGGAATATLADGRVLSFDGTTITLNRADGTALTTLHTYPGFSYPSFLLLDPSETFAVAGESSGQTLTRVELDGSGSTVLTTLTYNYDAAFEDATRLIVSAATCGFGCGNDLVRVDINTGATTFLAQVSGPSGPVTLDPAGNLYYATVDGNFPPTPGFTSVIGWSASQLTGDSLLTEADATTIATGFNGASALVCDAATGGLFLSENDFMTGSNVIFQVISERATSPALVTGSIFNSITNLEVIAGSGPAVFAPYQPSSGGNLRYNTTDFFSVFQRNGISPQRPSLAFSSTGPGGAASLDLELAPPLSLGLIGYGPSAGFSFPESAFPIPASVPILTGLGLTSLNVLPTPLFVSPSGAASLPIPDTTGLVGTLAAQVLLIDPILQAVGTSTPAFL